MKLFNKMKGCLEIHFFGVCAYIGEKLGIASSWIRLFFIYATFLTAGSPIFIYLSLAFLLKLKKFFTKRYYNEVWDI